MDMERKTDDGPAKSSECSKYLKIPMKTGAVSVVRRV